MTGIGRGKGRRGGKGRGCGNVGVLHDDFSATPSFSPNPQIQLSPDMGQSSNPHQVQSMDSLSSRAFVESMHPTPETENSGAGPGSRDIVNYYVLIMRSTISFKDGDWKAIIAKHEEAMWLKVKDKFETSGMREHLL